MSGERYYPKLGSGMLIAGSVTLVFTLVNTVFGPWPGHMSEKMYGLPLLFGLLGIETSQPIWGPTGEFSSQEFLLLFITLVCGAVAVWARRLRPDFYVPEGMTLSQHGEREFSRTQVSTTPLIKSNAATSSIVENIIGSTPTVDLAPVQNPVSNLGAAVAASPAPISGVGEVRDLGDQAIVENVPLPSPQTEIVEPVSVPVTSIPPVPEELVLEPINILPLSQPSTQIEELVSFPELELDLPALPDFSEAKEEKPVLLESQSTDLPPLPDV